MIISRVTVIDTLFKTHGRIRLYFPARVVVKTSVEDYTWISMVAEIGGYVGLFLGVAVVDCVHVMDVAWPKLKHLWRKIVGKKKSTSISELGLSIFKEAYLIASDKSDRATSDQGAADSPNPTSLEDRYRWERWDIKHDQEGKSEVTKEAHGKNEDDDQLSCDNGLSKTSTVQKQFERWKSRINK